MPLLTIAEPEIVSLAPWSVAPDLIVVVPSQLLAVLVRMIVPWPPMTRSWLGSTPAPVPVVIAPVSVAVTPASAFSVDGLAEDGVTTSSEMLLA